MSKIGYEISEMYKDQIKDLKERLATWQAIGEAYHKHADHEDVRRSLIRTKDKEAAETLGYEIDWGDD